MADRLSTPRAERAFGRFDPRRASMRLLAAVVAGSAIGLALPQSLSRGVRFVAGWDAGSLVLLVLALNIVFKSDATETQRRAAAVDPGRTVVWALVSLASSSACSLQPWCFVKRGERVRVARAYSCRSASER